MYDEIQKKLDDIHIDLNIRNYLEKKLSSGEVITSIDLRSSGILNRMLQAWKSDVKPLLEIALEIETLEYLYIRGGELDDESLALTIEYLPKLKNLKFIYFEAGKVTDDGIKLFADYLKQEEAVNEFTLYGIFGDKGLYHLLDVIKNDPKIDIVNINGEGISPVGVNAFLEFLSLDQLKGITFGCRKLDSNLCKRFEQILPKLTKLEYLVIQCPSIECFETILEGFGKNTSITEAAVFHRLNFGFGKSNFDPVLHNKYKAMNSMLDEVISKGTLSLNHKP